MKAMRNVVTSFLCSGIAIACGLGVFLAIFSAPVLLGKSDLMLAWGWVGWIPGILAGYFVGKLAYKISYERLQ